MEINKTVSAINKIVAALSPLICLVAFLIVCHSDLSSDAPHWQSYSGRIGFRVFMPLMLVSAIWIVIAYRNAKDWLWVLLPKTFLIWGLIALLSFILWIGSIF